MGFSFKKSFKIGGAKLNIGKKGASVSTGMKGLRLTTGANGSRLSAGAGGFRYTANIGKTRKTQQAEKSLTATEIFYSSLILLAISIFLKIKGFDFWGMTTWIAIFSFVVCLISFMICRTSKSQKQKAESSQDDYEN